MELTAENVHSIVVDCLFRDDEIENGKPKVPMLTGTGVVRSFGFHAERLTSHRNDVADMLNQLPDTFKPESQGGGGGWSFLNACVRKDGEQWGEHKDIEALVALGHALGMVKFPFPREMASVLPGGMPYIVIDTTAEAPATTDAG